MTRAAPNSHIQPQVISWKNILDYLTLSILQYRLNLVRHNKLLHFSSLSVTSSHYWHAAAYKVRLIVKEFPAAVPSQSNIFKTFSKISSELVSSQYQYIISCLFHTCRDSEERCVLGLRLMQANSNGFSFTHLKLSMKQWQIRMHDIHRTNKLSAQ